MATQQAAPTVAPTALTVDQLIAKNLEASKNSRSRTLEVQVTSISGWKSTSDGRQVKMVITDQGTFFPLESAITNIPTSIAVGKPVSAKAVLTPSKDGVFLNMSSLEFEGVDSKTANMIRMMPKGTALFALAV